MPLSDDELLQQFGQKFNLAPAQAVAGSTANPEDAAKALDLSNKTGAPASVIEPSLKEFYEKYKREQASDAVQTNPAAAGYVQSHPMAAKVSNDDWGSLGKVSQAYNDAVSQSLAGRVFSAFKENFGGTGSNDVGVSDEDYKKYPVTAALLDPFLTAYDVSAKTLSGTMGAGAALVGQSAAKVGMSPAWQARLERDLMIIQNGAMVETGMQPQSFILPKGKEIAVPEASSEGVPLDRRGKMEQAAQASGLTPEQTKEMSDVELRDHLIQNSRSAAGFTPEAEASIRAGEMPRPGADPIIDDLHVKQQQLDSIKVEKLIQESDQSLTKQRSPEMFAEFLRQHGEAQDISLPAEKVQELYAAENKTPEKGDGLFGYVPNIADQVKQGLETGTEVKIPFADFVANTNSALYGKVKDDLRFRDEGVTGTEAKELPQAEAEPQNEEIGAGKPPERGVAPANIGADGKIYIGGSNGFHWTLNERYADKIRAEQGLEPGEPTWKAEGFVNSAGKFMTRKEAYQWVAENEKKVKSSDNMEPNQLDSQDYYEQVREIRRVKAAEEVIKNDKDAQTIATAAEQQRQALFLNPLIKDGKALGIDETTFKRLSNRIEDSQNEIVTRALAAAERQAKKPLTEEWKKNEATTRFQVEEEFKKSPEIATDRFLRTNELPNGQRLKFEGKMNAGQVEDILGKEHSLGDLVQAKGGIDPQSVADLTGWDSPREMLKAIDEYNYGRKKLGVGPNTYLKNIIDNETANRMRAQYGQLPENILAEAREIAASDVAGKMLDTEISVLAKAKGFNLALDADQFKDKARADFSQLTLDQIPTEASLRRALEKGYKNAEKALAGGKFEDALKAMLARRQAFWTLRELKDFQRDQAKLDRDIGRVSNDDTVNRVDSAHVMQARGILNRLGVDGGSVPDDMPPFADFVRESDGRIAAADWITLNEGLRTSMDQLTVEEVRGLQKTLQSILHVGRDVKMFDTAFGQAALEDVVRETVKELDRFDLIKQPLGGATIPQRLGSMARSIGAANILPERILDYTDKFNPNGPLSKWMDRPLREAFGKELKYQEKIVNDIKELKDLSDTSTGSLIENKLIRDPLNNDFLQMDHWNLRKLMLYMGSESGKEKVVRGFFQGRGAKPLDPMEMDYYTRKVEKLIADNATEKDVKFVNKIFGIHEKLLPDIKELQLADTGVPMDTVRSRKYSTPAGDVDGGYIKVRYDKNRSSINEDIRSDQSWFESGYRTITTPQGYTIRRTGYSGFLDLDMTLFPSELQSVVHDLAFRTAVRNAGKLVNDPNFAMAMRQKWGTQYADLFPQWLKDIANSNTVDDTYAKGFVKLLKDFRQNVVSALVGFNVGTMEKHGISALGMSVKEVGAKSLFSNMAKMATADAKDLVDQAVKSNPELADFYKSLTTEKGMSELNFALQSSPILRNRVRKYNETVYGAYDEATAMGLWGKAKNIRQLSMYFGRMPISLIDGMSTFPEWLASYKREMGASGDHGTAVYAADKAVSRSHGSAFIGDAPAILRQKNTLGGEVMRWVTPLYRFWNHNFNLLAGEKWDIGAKMTGRDEPGANWKNIATTAFWVTVVPIIAEELAAPALDTHKGSSLLQAIGRYFGGQLPFVRDISNAVLGGYEPSVGFLGTVGHQLTLAAHEVGRQGDKAISRLMTGLAMLTGVGSQPIGNAAQYGHNVLSGRERPQNPSQIMQGLRTGSQRPRRY